MKLPPAEYVEDLVSKMGSSAFVLSLFTEDYKEGIDSLLQFALALMLDKPLYLLVKAGTAIPEKVRRVADGIEYFGPDRALEDAAHALLALATKKGDLP